MNNPSTEHQTLLMFVMLLESRDIEKPQELWVEVTEADVQAGTVVTDGPMSKPKYYQRLRKTLRGCVPGAVFAVTLTKTGLSYTPKSTPVMAYSDTKKIAQWRAMTIGVERAAQAAKALANSVLTKHDRERMEPLRTAYRQSSGAARVQILAEFVRFITGSSAG
jgi:hypothetical protein